MLRYNPKLANGRKAPLTWPLRLFRRFNHISWPLEDGVSDCVQRMEIVGIFLGFLILIFTNESEVRNIRLKINVIDDLLTGIAQYLLLWEILLRSMTMAWRKDQTKKQLKKFYAEIYVQKKDEPLIAKNIQRQLIPSKLMASMYWFSFVSFCFAPLIHRSKDLLFEMVPPFDVTPLHIYLAVVFTNIWTGMIAVTTIFGEMNLLGELLMHLNARYHLLRRDLNQFSEHIRKNCSSEEMSKCFGRMLADVLQRNVKLNLFATQVEREAGFRFFVSFGLSTTTMCALLFQSYTNPIGNVAVTFLFFAKFVELMTIGNMGTILHTTTDGLSNMYYESNWEDVLIRSTNPTEDVQLMKLIAMAIQFNEKPFSLTAMKYFRISMNTVVKILQGAMSYFTFLLSKR